MRLNVMDLGLQGKVALVTGASRGIGKAAAEAFGKEGARVAVTYKHDRIAAEGTAAALRGWTDACALPLDLASGDSIRRAVDSVLDTWGHIDILVNNAIAWSLRPPEHTPPFERLAPAEWRSVLRTNIEGPFALVQAVLPSMRDRRWGRILSVGSLAASDGLAGGAWYCTAKAALHGLTRSLAREVGEAGILANVITPGFTLTERLDAVLPQSIRERATTSTPIGRLLTPQDLAPVIVFLCSTANTAITGQVVRTSGGA